MIKPLHKSPRLNQLSGLFTDQPRSSVLCSPAIASGLTGFFSLHFYTHILKSEQTWGKYGYTLLLQTVMLVVIFLVDLASNVFRKA